MRYADEAVVIVADSRYSRVLENGIDFKRWFVVNYFLIIKNRINLSFITKILSKLERFKIQRVSSTKCLSLIMHSKLCWNNC